MNGQPAIAYEKYIINDFLLLVEPFCVWKRNIFDWCNKLQPMVY